MHVFFDCNFARCCWQHAGLEFDMGDVFSAPEWLLHKLNVSPQDELIKISTVLYGIWVWRNKRVWENKVVSGAIVLSWVLSREEMKATVETDSLLTVDAINGHWENVLEVGHIIDQCNSMPLVMPDVSVKYVRKRANKVAHGLARLPCRIDCLNIYTLYDSCTFGGVLFAGYFLMK